MSRLALQLAALVVLSITISNAQTGDRDVVVSGASSNDPYSVTARCEADGQVYRWASMQWNQPGSIMRVARDGSTVLFMLPQRATPGIFSATTDGLYVLSDHPWKGEGRAYDFYQYDSHGNLLKENLVHTDFEIIKMVVLPSSTIVVVTSFRGKDPEDWKYGGAVLNATGEVVKTFDLPLPPGGGGWTYASPLGAENNVAYSMLHANFGNQTAIATISESGHLDIKMISVPNDSERHHNQWIFGNGMAVEVYHYIGERPHVSFHFDEYDLATGTKIATKKTAPGQGGYNVGCYYGNEVTWLADSAHVDPARGLAPDAMRLVTTALQKSQ
jgi:hypothetical protein